MAARPTRRTTHSPLGAFSPVTSTADNGTRGAAKDLAARRNGRFYTHELIGRHLADAVSSSFRIGGKPAISLIDPFCGDGRLVRWLLEALAMKPNAKKVRWHIDLWDSDPTAVRKAERDVADTGARLGLKVAVNTFRGDSFQHAQGHLGTFSICVTNPPWEMLKPDRRELATLNESETEQHINKLREQSALLGRLYPLAARHQKFSGWGTNLARCGTEVALRLASSKGICGVVSPASLLADQRSAGLRTWLFTDHRVLDVAYYVAEARLFENVDQQSITFVAHSEGTSEAPPKVTVFDRGRRATRVVLALDDWKRLEKNGFVFPVQFGLQLMKYEKHWASFPKFVDLEGPEASALWAGRELDETGHQRFLGDRGTHRFLKGRMVVRYGLAEEPKSFVKPDGPKVPTSAAHYRLAWRDVSRPNQKRRIHATIIPPGWVTGNSLSIAYFKDDDQVRLKALLAVVNSFVFEAQARAKLATSHVSLGAVRQVRMPRLDDKAVVRRLSSLVDRCMAGEPDALVEVELAVARLYGLKCEEFQEVLSSFEKLSPEERETLLSSGAWKSVQDYPRPSLNGKAAAVAADPIIPNHYSAALSELDRIIVHSVPPGGNWKNIPESVPSERLKQIRVSFAAGEGSRSTYYGRLRPDAPAYTINTYFPRPGNGCHIHYAYEGGQHRTLSQREAARLQSFPDSFVFSGSRNAVNQQIGNAVPPLLAYQIARSIPFKGLFVDLFSGAGGLALGFKWAGWTPVVANDIEEPFLATFRANVHPATVRGDIREKAVFDEVVRHCREARAKNPGLPLLVLGGPPCQGFSTAGNRRSMDDERNWLFHRYKALLEVLMPAGFIFENVPGLLNMEGGRVFEMIRAELEQSAKRLTVWKVRAEQYGVPQRRTRIVLVGDSDGRIPNAPPARVTQLGGEPNLFEVLAPAVTVEQALSDLPSLQPGEDGSHKTYVHGPRHPYQDLMRGNIGPAKFLEAIRAGVKGLQEVIPPLPELARSGRRPNGG